MKELELFCLIGLFVQNFNTMKLSCFLETNQRLHTITFGGGGLVMFWSNIFYEGSRWTMFKSIYQGNGEQSCVKATFGALLSRMLFPAHIPTAGSSSLDTQVLT
jgi:hypothetical protein